MTVAWFENSYQCARCQRSWQSEWSCACDDDCPFCGARHMAPTMSNDVTEIVEEHDGSFIVLRSPGGAEHKPAYEEVDRFPCREAAAAYLLALQRSPRH